jgi:myo-inositol-1(or 4)-monophosphatase
MVSREEIVTYGEECKTLAIKAGAILKEGFGSHFEIHSKASLHDLVTEYDQKSENFLIGEIKKKHPHHAILSEESGSQGVDSPYCWVMDPLDGTVNFAHEIPIFSVSIALCYENQVIAGCVYHPMMNELFTATLGGGSFLGNRPLNVSAKKTLGKSLGATGFPHDAEKNPHNCLGQFITISQKGSPLRRLGSAAIDLCYLATGRFDFFWEDTLQAWDFAAGALIVKEAGGTITTVDGHELSPLKASSVIASNAHLHPELISTIQGSWR